MLYYSLQAKLLPTTTYTYDLQREEKDKNEKSRWGKKNGGEGGGGKTNVREGRSLFGHFSLLGSTVVLQAPKTHYIVTYSYIYTYICIYKYIHTHITYILILDAPQTHHFVTSYICICMYTDTVYTTMAMYILRYFMSLDIVYTTTAMHILRYFMSAAGKAASKAYQQYILLL
jgi:hypothetical protein